jgi:lysophospholipase L1-like esterase
VIGVRGRLARRGVALSRRTLPALLCPILASAACGSGGGSDAHSAAARPATAAGVRIAAAADAGGLRSWDGPVVSGGRHGYVATFRSGGSRAAASSSQPVKARLGGLGYPAEGKVGATTFVGPAVASAWTTIAHGQYTVTVTHQGQWLGLKIWSRGGRWRAKVDGRYVDPNPRSVGSGSAIHTIGLDFSHAQPSRRRVVRFELSGGAWLAGVVAGKDDKLTLPARPPGPSVYWLGDSYFAGGGSRYPGFSDLVHTASARLGFQDVTVDALGGTGYIRDNTAAKFPDFLTRARKSIGKGRAQPDLIVVGGSINDIGQDVHKVGAAARQLYAYLGKADPAAKIVVVVFTPRFPVPANFAALNRAILRSAAASPNVAGAFDLPAHVARSADGLQGANSHPTQAGHDVYGRLIADFIRTHH